MGRTTGPDEASPRAKKGERGRGPRSTQPRSVLISKACSRLLRHQAVNEGVPITNDGWVRLDHLLAWKGLSSRNGLSPTPTLEEIWTVVEENEKKRFAVRWIGKGTTPSHTLDSVRPTEPTEVEKASNTTDGIQDQPATTIQELIDPVDKASNAMSVSASENNPSATSDVQTDSETARAIEHYRNTTPPPPATEFQIRAVQGHSIQTVASDTSLLKPITLDNPKSIPDTCVHGTFYGAWPSILQSGGLKRMGRNHVHFASGPTLTDVGITEEGAVTRGKPDKVISGMRNDAQLLIYIDLQRCLQEVKDLGVEMQWWRSENEVILTEGIDEIPTPVGISLDGSTTYNGSEAGLQNEPQTAQSSTEDAVHGMADLKVHEAGLGGRFKTARSKNAQAAGQSNKLVPMRFWKVVVDVKGGQGIIWRQGEGVIKELPEHLLSKGNPKTIRGRGRGERGRGG